MGTPEYMIIFMLIAFLALVFFLIKGITLFIKNVWGKPEKHI